MIERRSVDGVPVLLAPTTGPAHAGLAFRVGHADEPPARRGITHLIEHLVDHRHNGVTGPVFTYFHVQGDEQEMVTFLAGVCASLRELPMHRRDTVEPPSAPAVTESMWRWRYGARDNGLAAITEDDLRDWVGRWFTRENAVLWVAGEKVPADLRLDLPSGVRRPLPAPSSALPVTPASVPGGPDVIGWSAVAPRSAAASVFAAVLDRMMVSELGPQAGLATAVRTDQQPFGVDSVLVSAIAEAAPEKRGAVPGALIDLLATLRAGRVDEAELTAAVTERIEALRHAEETAGRLPEQAFRLLLGREVEDVEDAVAGLRAVTVAEVAEVAAAAWSTGLLMSPTPADWAGFTPAPAEPPIGPEARAEPEQPPKPRSRNDAKPAWWRELARGWRRAHWQLRWSFAGAVIGAVGFAVVALQAAIESAQTSDALFTLVVALLCVGVFGRAAWKRAGLLRAG